MILFRPVAALAALALLASAPAHAQDAPAACRALADSRTLPAALIGTLLGDAQSFERVRAGMAAVDQAPVQGLQPLAASMHAHAAQLLQRQAVVNQYHDQLRALSTRSLDLLEGAETLLGLELQNGANPAEIAAASQLAMLSQRLGRSADNFLGWDGVRPEAVFLLGKDLKATETMLQGLKDGNAGLRLRTAREPAIRNQLARTIAVEAEMRQSAEVLLSKLQDFVVAREAQAALQREADVFGHELALRCAGSDAGSTGPLRLPVQPSSTAAKAP